LRKSRLAVLLILTSLSLLGTQISQALATHEQAETSEDRHWVFTFKFSTYSISADHAGVYTVDMTITALYWKVGYIIKATLNPKPSGVIVMVMPPVGFFKETGSKDAKLMVIVLPGATKGAFQIWLEVTQIIPPYPPDTHTWTSCPILYIT